MGSLKEILWAGLTIKATKCYLSLAPCCEVHTSISSSVGLSSWHERHSSRWSIQKQEFLWQSLMTGKTGTYWSQGQETARVQSLAKHLSLHMWKAFYDSDRAENPEKAGRHLQGGRRAPPAVSDSARKAAPAKRLSPDSKPTDLTRAAKWVAGPPSMCSITWGCKAYHQHGHRRARRNSAAQLQVSASPGCTQHNEAITVCMAVSALLAVWLPERSRFPFSFHPSVRLKIAARDNLTPENPTQSSRNNARISAGRRNKHSKGRRSSIAFAPSPKRWDFPVSGQGGCPM